MANFSEFSVSDVVVNPKGANLASLTANSQPVTLYIESRECTIRAPFTPSVFDGSESARVNFELRLHEEARRQLSDFDTWAVNYIHQHSERLLNK